MELTSNSKRLNLSLDLRDFFVTENKELFLYYKCIQIFFEYLSLDLRDFFATENKELFCITSYTELCIIAKRATKIPKKM